MTTSYELGLSLKGLSRDELKALLRARKIALALLPIVMTEDVWDRQRELAQHIERIRDELRGTDENV